MMWMLREGLEAVSLVEARRGVVFGMDDDGSAADLVRSGATPGQSVSKQVGTEATVLLWQIDRQAG